MQIRYLFQRMVQKRAESASQSSHVCPQAAVDAFIANPGNTFLVSFPRTGSHWLRMLMELYFRRPSLVRTFYYSERSDYLIQHTHDDELDLQRRNVIYLYRDPVDTVYSQLCYHREAPEDDGRVVHWSSGYACHLDKWLLREDFTEKKTVVTYENLKNEMVSEFAKIVSHFGQEILPERLQEAASEVTKEEVRRKTAHDEQVISLEAGYAEKREEFRLSKGDLVRATVISREPRLGDCFRE